jgi:acetyl-CoA acetyltransferase family protein
LHREAVIVSAVRTPVGKYGGVLASMKDYELGATVIKEAVQRAGINPSMIDGVYMGNLLGLPGNIARVAALKAGLSENVPAACIDRQCASGLETIGLSAALIQSGYGNIYVAGGTESMTNRHFYLEKSSKPYPYTPPQFLEAMFVPPELEDQSMGQTAENVLELYTISREELDEFALRSHQRANDAIENGLFKDQIVPVSMRYKRETLIIDQDESPRKDTDLAKLGKLKPIFKKDGKVTAGNSCPMNDGASAVVMMDKNTAINNGHDIMGVVRAYTTVGLDYKVMGLGPIYAVRKLLEMADMKINDIDLVELNEAFASQAIVCIQELKLDIQKVNINGGAIALGHPLGATGTVLATKLLYDLRKRNQRFGIVTMCVGGGQGSALLIENIAALE